MQRSVPPRSSAARDGNFPFKGATMDDSDWSADAHRDMKRWKAAKSFEDLCELMALFVLGEMKFSPGYFAESVTEETKSIATYLARINRAGFLTIDSQPGSPLKGKSGQRAYVCGYAHPNTAAVLSARLVPTDLYFNEFHSFEPLWRSGEVGEHRIAVTLSNGTTLTSVANCNSTNDLQSFWEDIGHAAYDDLEQMNYCIGIDFQWGRSDELFRQIADAQDGSKKRGR